MTKRKWHENTKLTWVIISLITISVIVGNAFLARRTISSLSVTQTSLLNAGQVLNALNNLHILVLSAETGQRGYLLTEDEQYLAPYTDALSQLQMQLSAVKEVNSEIPNQKQRINTLLALTEEKLEELKTTVALALADEERTAIKMVLTGRGRNLYKQIHAQFDEIEASETEFRRALFAKLSAAEKEAKVTFSLSAVTSALLLFGMVFLARINIRIEQRFRSELEQQNKELAAKVEERTLELNIYSEELKRSNRELEDFAFVASHDLQEPLRKIRAFGDRLQTSYAQDLDPKGFDYINRMRNAAERMSDLISDLLEFSRITTRGKDFVDVDLNQTIATIVDDLEIAIAESGAVLELAKLPTIQADPSQIYQLLLNLISNAVKFKRVDIPPLIRFEYQLVEGTPDVISMSENWHVLTITDNGIGFEQEYADKIFAPFQRLHSRTEYKGTGIGLAVCRRIVERHHGTITATSSVGKGASFCVKLPADLVQLNLDREIRNAI